MPEKKPVNSFFTGNGTIFILKISLEKGLEVIRHEVASDVLTDLAFHPLNEGIFVTSGGNGQLVIHDQSPMKKTVLLAHTAEISSVEWGVPSTLLTASWDGSVKMVRFAL